MLVPTILSYTQIMGNYILNLYSIYEQLLQVLESEKSAIGAYNLKEFEANLDVKKELELEMSKIIPSLLQTAKELGDICDYDGEISNITQIKDLIHGVDEFLVSQNLSSKMWVEHRKNLLLKMTNFQNFAHSSQRAIEGNRVLMERVIANHQESILFWQRVFTELNSSYDASGQMRKDIAVSHIEVKA